MTQQVFSFRDLPNRFFVDPNEKKLFHDDSLLVTKTPIDGLSFAIKVLPAKNDLLSIQWLIGENVKLRKFRALVKSSCLEIEDGVSGSLDVSFWDNSFLKIGANSSFSGLRVVLDRRAICDIGPDALISDGVCLQVGDQHAIIDLEDGSVVNQSNSSLSIESHVWLGRDAKVIASRAVSIGSGSIVAMGSVVAASISKNTLNAGVPSRQIRANVSWHRSRHPSSFEISQLMSALKSCDEVK